MIMPPQPRKLALTVHVTCSVGWFGAVAGFLALAVAGLVGQNPQAVRTAYLGMPQITWFGLGVHSMLKVPFSEFPFLQFNGLDSGTDTISRLA